VGRASRADIDRLKRDTNLLQLACQRFGYAVDELESTPRGNPTNWVLRRPNDDAKLLLRMSARGYWLFLDVHGVGSTSPSSHAKAGVWGSALDFVQAELHQPKGPSFGLALRELRQHVHGGTAPILATPINQAHRATGGPPAPAPTVAARWARALEATTSGYLEQRGISPAILTSQRFRGTWRVHRGQVFFAHRNQTGQLTGFEIKGGPVPFPKGGVKTGCFRTNPQPRTTHLVLTESAVEALSFAQLNSHLEASFRSFGGRIGVHQLAGLRAELATLAALARPPVVLLAFDDDRDGRRYAEQVRRILPTRLIAEEVHPPAEEDWNAYLQANNRQSIAGNI
jgi:hypothetical protein